VVGTPKANGAQQWTFPVGRFGGSYQATEEAAWQGACKKGEKGESRKQFHVFAVAKKKGGEWRPF